MDSPFRGPWGDPWVYCLLESWPSFLNRMDSLDSSAPLYSPRYLVPLDLRNVPQYRFDAVVVGSGAGGSTAALEAAGTGASVALL